MKSLRTRVGIAAGLGLLSVMGIVLCHLALTDIAHGGEDLRAEWLALQIGFGAVILFHLAAFNLFIKLFTVIKNVAP